MIKSMTGFGRGTASSPEKKITVEIKSLNSKQLDLMVRIPSVFREDEIMLRQEVARRLSRGKVELTAVCENIGAEAPASINRQVVAAYKAQMEELSRELSIPLPQDWYSTLLRLPEALKAEQAELSEEDKEAFMQAASEAMTALDAFRSQEGARLEVFFRRKVENIAALLVETEVHEAERVPLIRKRLEEELEKLSGIEYDRGRLEQEMIFYIEKLDVNEEKQRLRSHLNYFIETMESDDAAGHGKKLGFIAQEMGREINTLGSKSNNAGMQRCVVRMKDELEQIKEQVLNVL